MHIPSKALYSVDWPWLTFIRQEDRGSANQRHCVPDCMAVSPQPLCKPISSISPCMRATLFHRLLLPNTQLWSHGERSGLSKHCRTEFLGLAEMASSAMVFYFFLFQLLLVAFFHLFAFNISFIAWVHSVGNCLLSIYFPHQGWEQAKKLATKQTGRNE